MATMPIGVNRIDVKNGLLRQLIIVDPMNPLAAAVVCITRFDPSTGTIISKMEIPYTTQLLVMLHNDPDMVTRDVLPIIREGLQECAAISDMNGQQAQQWLSGELFNLSGTTPSPSIDNTEGGGAMPTIRDEGSSDGTTSVGGTVNPPEEQQPNPTIYQEEGQVEKVSAGPPLMQGTNPLQNQPQNVGPIKRPSSM